MKNYLFYFGFLFCLLKIGVIQAKEQTTIVLDTNQGEIKIRLFNQLTPLTVTNFLQYVNEQFFDNTIFHRVVDNYIIQGGAYNIDLTPKTPTHEAIINEAPKSSDNLRGTIAMARPASVNQSQAQFFINLKDNHEFHYDFSRGEDGYVVFGKVIEGMDIIDQIAAVDVHFESKQLPHLPNEPVIIKKINVLNENMTPIVEINDQQKSETIFNWAEKTYPELFTEHLSTFKIDGFLARGAYAKTNFYMGTKAKKVYVFGDLWNGLAEAGELDKLYQQIK